MTSIRAVAAGLALVLLSAPGRAQDTPESSKAALELDAKLIANAKSTSEIMKNLQHLSDVIGPRLTGSANLKRANEWTAEVMRRYGLTNVKLEPWEIPSGWERGTATMKVVEPDSGRSLTVAARAWTPGTAGKITGDVVVLKVQKKEDFAQYQGKLKGAIVLRGDPAEVRPITDLSYGPGGGPKSKDGKKPEEKLTFQQQRELDRELSAFLRPEGAVVLVSDSGKPHNLLTMTGAWQGEDRAKAPEPLPSLFMAHEHYAMLHRLAGRKDAKTRVEVEISNKFIAGPITVYNTVGEIAGENPDEFVVVGAHLDSWDLAQGTTDNGTGSCVVLETARLIAKSGVKPKRTIRFVLFTGEEQGLHGSKQYVKRHAEEMPYTSVALVHDTGTGKVQGFGLQGRDAVKTLMDRELVSLKDLGFSGVTLKSLRGTDHLSFESVGVPGFACEQDMDEYRLTHHTQSDTFDKAKEPNLIQGAQVMSVTAMRIANLPAMLSREKKERLNIPPREVPGKK